MKIEVSITKQHILSLFIAIAIVAGISYALAYGTNDPLNFGHSIGEIDFTGGFTVPSGDIEVSGGNIEVSSGDVIVSDGDIRTTELLADTVNSTDVNVDGNIKLGGVVKSSWPTVSDDCINLDATAPSSYGSKWTFCDAGYVMVGVQTTHAAYDASKLDTIRCCKLN